MHPSYLAHCRAAYKDLAQRHDMAIFLIEKTDYVGTLVHAHLALQKEYAEFFSDEKFIVARLPKVIGKASVQQIFSSLSQDFYVENFNRVDEFSYPIMIFSDSTSTVIDLKKN